MAKVPEHSQILGIGVLTDGRGKSVRVRFANGDVVVISGEEVRDFDLARQAKLREALPKRVPGSRLKMR